MPARNEQLRGSPPDRQGDLESPFLDEELFAGEGEAGWEHRLTALEAESPFLHAFEEWRAPGVEPEADDEEAEGYGPPDEESGWGEEIFEQLFVEEEPPYEPRGEFEEPETVRDDLPAFELERQTEDLLEAWGGGEGQARGEGDDEESFEMPAWESEAWLEEQEREEPSARYATFEPEVESQVGAAVAAGREDVARMPLLSRHRALGPDLILTWNEMASTPRAVDVVVHLHGFSMSSGQPLNARDRARRSGLDWSDPERKDTSPGRRRPTVGLLPKGHFYGGRTGRGHNFPGLLTSTGLQELIDFALGRLAQRFGVTDLKAGRVILTAHSGGGAALLKILRHHNPHEVHLFDALYQAPSAVVEWARARLAADRAVLEAGATTLDQYMPDRGGALRVLYRPGTPTEPHSRVVYDALNQLIPSGSPLARWYKVDSTRVPHLLVGPTYGWRLLADAGAALPSTSPPPPALKRREVPEAEWESPEEWESPGFSEEGWEEERADLDDPEVELSEAEALKEWEEVSDEAEAPGTVPDPHPVPVPGPESYAEMARKILRKRDRKIGVVLTVSLFQSADGKVMIDTQTEKVGGRPRLKNPPAHVVLPADVYEIKWGKRKIQYVWILSNEKSVFPVGGVLFLPQANDPQFYLATFNVGSLDRGCTNVHHAEMQAVRWVEEQPKPWRARIGRIWMYNFSRAPKIGYSPCNPCCVDLARFLTDLKALGGGSPSGTVYAVMAWLTVYDRNAACGHPTDAANLRRMESSGWELYGPRPRAIAGAGTVPSNDKVIAAVERYRPLVEAAAAKYGVESALIRGVIAAESGGDKDLVAKSGYTGLMQAEKGEAHKRPETSIDAGTKKLRDFRVIMEGILKEHGRRYDQLPEAEQLRLLALAYNAGPVTVAKALQYAAAAGGPERWLDAEHYKRALLFTGAYSLKQAEAGCLAGKGQSEKDALSREAVRVWNQWRLGTKKTDWRKLDDPPPWQSISASLQPFVVCAIDFKHRNSPNYAARILAYQDRFKSN